MEGNIINPWWFYLISFFSNLSTIFRSLFAIILLAFVCSAIIFFVTFCIGDLEEEQKPIYLKILKALGIFIICTGMISAIIPSEKAMYEMMIASCVTYENVDYALDAIEDGVDYIFEKLDSEDAE